MSRLVNLSLWLSGPTRPGVCLLDSHRTGTRHYGDVVLTYRSLFREQSLQS